MKRIVLLAPLAGLLGGLMGAAVLTLIAVAEARSAPAAAVAASQALVLGSLFAPLLTVPGCVILGTPVIYAFRHHLPKRPFAWGLLIGLLGVFIGVTMLGWAFRSNSNPEGLLLLSLFSATSGFSQAVLYGWRTKAVGRLGR